MACWLEAAFTFHLDGTCVVPFFFWADSAASANQWQAGEFARMSVPFPLVDFTIPHLGNDRCVREYCRT